MLTEIVVAAALVLSLLASLFSLLAPAHGAVRLQPRAAEMQQRMRSAVARLHADLVMAGSGGVPGSTVTLGWLRAPVVPAPIGRRYPATAGTTFEPDAISLLSVPPRDAGARLASQLALTGGMTRVRLDSRSCRTVSCGVAADGLAATVDETGRSTIFRVTRVRGDTLWLRALGGGAFDLYEPGDAIVPVEIRSYYFDHRTAQIRFQNGWLTDVPVLDHVAGLSFRYFGRPAAAPPAGDLTQAAACLRPRHPSDPPAAMPEPSLPSPLSPPSLVELDLSVLTDGPWCGGSLPYDIDLFRIRTVRVEIRLQVADLALRGGAPGLFARPGPGVGVHQVPDLTATFEVAPRGLRGSW